MTLGLLRAYHNDVRLLLCSSAIRCRGVFFILCAAISNGTAFESPLTILRLQWVLRLEKISLGRVDAGKLVMTSFVLFEFLFKLDLKLSKLFIDVSIGLIATRLWYGHLRRLINCSGNVFGPALKAWSFRLFNVLSEALFNINFWSFDYFIKPLFLFQR